MGELTRARQVPTASELAPGDEATFRALTDPLRRPPEPRAAIPAEALARTRTAGGFYPPSRYSKRSRAQPSAGRGRYRHMQPARQARPSTASSTWQRPRGRAACHCAQRRSRRCARPRLRRKGSRSRWSSVVSPCSKYWRGKRCVQKKEPCSPVWLGRPPGWLRGVRACVRRHLLSERCASVPQPRACARGWPAGCPSRKPSKQHGGRCRLRAGRGHQSAVQAVPLVPVVASAVHPQGPKVLRRVTHRPMAVSCEAA